jgi:Arc/MetJ-type ribon-helix-helix transcriptional regulator
VQQRLGGVLHDPLGQRCELHRHVVRQLERVRTARTAAARTGRTAAGQPHDPGEGEAVQRDRLAEQLLVLQDGLEREQVALQRAGVGARARGFGGGLAAGAVVCFSV